MILICFVLVSHFGGFVSCIKRNAQGISIFDENTRKFFRRDDGLGRTAGSSLYNSIGSIKSIEFGRVKLRFLVQTVHNKRIVIVWTDKTIIQQGYVFCAELRNDDFLAFSFHMKTRAKGSIFQEYC